MDDEEDTPLVFANQVMDQFADHLVGRKPKSNDYIVLRTTFRKLGGSWMEICSGNIQHLKLLGEVVKAWGKRAQN